MTTEQQATISTSFKDILGKEHVFELQINTEIFTPFSIGDCTVYVEGKSEYQARLALADALVLTANKMGAKRVGELAIAELERQKNEK